MQNGCRENFDELNKNILSCNKCSELAALRKTAVPGIGALNSRIMIVGFYPKETGAEITGEPFTNDESGLLIRKLISDSDLSIEEDIYLTYLVKCTPRKKVSARSGEKISSIPPLKVHQENCVGHLIKEISISTPHLLISLGLRTSKFILKHFFSINKNFTDMDQLHMKIFENPSFKLVPFYSPHNVTIEKKISVEKYSEDFKNLSKLLKIV